ncbi:hypothetical protein PCASD_04635 [Puccinia coronata f. sp. avenae]|uniref:Uncharacterized protein n=1 Tax=Puccinia coronata f. sp. avenae TaxID=200324 RepID=A0A2N5UXS0_9BASI|nr:hypothetical protein PCASD_04635 [Puccinia coronata f. sp. avenae]
MASRLFGGYTLYKNTRSTAPHFCPSFVPQYLPKLTLQLTLTTVPSTKNPQVFEMRPTSTKVAVIAILGIFEGVAAAPIQRTQVGLHRRMSLESIFLPLFGKKKKHTPPPVHKTGKVNESGLEMSYESTF